MPRNTTTIYSEFSSGIIESAIEWDGEGRGFLVVAHAPDPLDNNVTFADVLIAEDGEHFTRVDTIDPDLKITSVKMTHRDVGDPKERLVVIATTRRGGTGQVEVDTNVEMWTMDNVFAPLQAPAPTPTPEPPIPCVPPGNKPYFRPNRTVTRGQVAKMIAIATGRADPNDPNPPITQTFEDVQVGSTFHEFVEVLAEDEVMGGYPCEEGQ